MTSSKNAGDWYLQAAAEAERLAARARTPTAFRGAVSPRALGVLGDYAPATAVAHQELLAGYPAHPSPMATAVRGGPTPTLLPPPALPVRTRHVRGHPSRNLLHRS